MTRYIHEPFNITDTGLTLLQINPERAADLRKDSRYFGWLFYRHPDGQWVTLRKLSAAEIDEAQDQASDMNVLDRPAPEGAAPTPPSAYVERAQAIIADAFRFGGAEGYEDETPLAIIAPFLEQGIAVALEAAATDLERHRCSAPSQEDTGPVSGPMVERVAAALDATPNLFLRVNKGRADGYSHEICWPGEPIVVIAAYRDHAEAVSRRGQLQLRAYARAAIAVMFSPPTDAGDQLTELNNAKS